MHRPFRFLSSCIVITCLTATACSDVHPVSVRPPGVEVVKTESRRAWSLEPLGDALAFRAAERRVYESAWVIAVAKGVAARGNEPTQRRRSDTAAALRPPRAATSLSPCGGDLPPCYVAARESGGSYGAYNPNGCGGSGCYGKWQFSGEWAGKLGLPNDLSTATPAQQDAAARALYNGGAGCSNWDSC